MSLRLSMMLAICLTGHCLEAAINPLYKECMQRGYEISGDHCVFPDSSRCLLEAFNDGQCGQQWMTDDYCIPKGRYVWDEDRCCDGLVAYLPEGMAGQATCEPKSKVIQEQISGGGSFWYLLVIVLLLGSLLLLRFKRPDRSQRRR